MKTIWKFDIQPGEFTIEAPANAVPLSVQMQGDYPRLWMLILDDQDPKIERKFIVVGTGHEIKVTGLKFIGTFQMSDEVFGISVPRNLLVWHLFELG